ncbi:uncharacterized protein LOC109705114 isoform X1 [Ananas comosus]|uniref:Uncharacterized protein LOC109705114 isoform X1 n=1 Tax=Ananas comosus TaxID=4615 RepID=A0A6P5EJ66_ANACO|nr:uncharacterized protein LOC109705114 isoform X1 [Ananas comosus]
MAMSLLRPPPPSSPNLHRPSPLSSSSSSSLSPYSHFPIHVAVSKPYLAPTTLPYALRPPFSSLSSAPSYPNASTLAPSVGSPSTSPQLARWSLGRDHIFLLNITACAVAISASWLFFSAIPTLLAFRKAAESLEKLLDVTAEELPDTMAAVRLSGMEISDLTMELSDLGHEITQGVRSSTRAVRVAEDRLRRLTNMAPVVSVQGKATLRNETETEIQGPMLARTARNLREGIVKGRAGFGVIFSIIQFSRWGLNFLSARRQKRSA